MAWRRPYHSTATVLLRSDILLVHHTTAPNTTLEDGFIKRFVCTELDQKEPSYLHKIDVANHSETQRKECRNLTARIPVQPAIGGLDVCLYSPP